MDRRDFLASTAATLADSLWKTNAHHTTRSTNAESGADMAAEPRFRQINLDFHTGELITDVGADFRAEEFLATFQAAHVNSINLFAKCHHGWAYYDTKVAHRILFTASSRKSQSRSLKCCASTITRR